MTKINQKRKQPAVNQKNIQIPNESTDKEEESIAEHAPYVIVVHGPPKVGKSTLIKSLVRHFTSCTLTDEDFWGIISVLINNIPGKKERRLQFVECPNNVNGMIDAAKYADAVILVVDISYGFEMETFEFVSLLKAHGMPKVIGVFTHLDCFFNKDVEIEKRRTAHWSKNFRKEIYEEAEIFCPSAPFEDDKLYAGCELWRLASYLSHIKFHPLSWRAGNSYVLVDGLVDATPQDRLRMDTNCARDLMLYGFLRGDDIKEPFQGIKVHIAGVGDFPLALLASSPDLKMKIYKTDQSNLNEETHLKKGIFRIGSYLILKVCNVPCGMLKNCGPYPPILVGDISSREEIVGRISARFERHSFHMKSLSTKDPITVSVGWRRYSATPTYALKDLRETLEFPPEDKSYYATFWGPSAPSGTEVVAVQILADNKAAFRILATGKVLSFSRSTGVGTRRTMKKPHMYGPLVTALEPSNRIWKDSTKESEKREAHVVWSSLERTLAPEDWTEAMSEIQEDLLKLPSQKRKTDEQRRAVIIVDRLEYGNTAELDEAYRKRKEEDIRNKVNRGMVTRFVKRGPGFKKHGAAVAVKD